MKLEKYDLVKIFLLSRKLERSQGNVRMAIKLYWRLMLYLTKIIERTVYRFRIDTKGHKILNFGCGTHLIRGLNSDLFPVHRYFRGLKKPDVFLTGTFVPPRLDGFFEAIICEHVLEHLFPHDAFTLLCNFRRMLQPGGFLQISVPSIIRLLDCKGDTHSFDVISVNNIIYNYQHHFMYDESSLVSLLTAAGFHSIMPNSFESSAWKPYLTREREPESIYILARNSQ